MVEASCRLTLADVLPTGTFLAVSPFITASVIGSLFAFTAVYTKRAQIESAALLRSGTEPPRPAGAAPAPLPPDNAADPTIPLP